MLDYKLMRKYCLGVVYTIFGNCCTVRITKADIGVVFRITASQSFRVLFKTIEHAIYINMVDGGFEQGLVFFVALLLFRQGKLKVSFIR